MLPLLFIAWASCCKLILLLNMKFYNVDCTKNFLMEQFRAAAERSGIPRDYSLYLSVITNPTFGRGEAFRSWEGEDVSN